MPLQKAAWESKLQNHIREEFSPIQSLVCRHSSRHDFVSYIGKTVEIAVMKTNCGSLCQNILWKNPPLTNNVFGLYFTRYLKKGITWSVEQPSGNPVSTGLAVCEETGNHLIPVSFEFIVAIRFWVIHGLPSATDWIKNTEPS